MTNDQPTYDQPTYSLRDLYEALAMTRSGLVRARRRGYIPEPDIPASFPRSSRRYSADLFSLIVREYRSAWVPVAEIMGIQIVREQAWWWRQRLGGLSLTTWGRLRRAHGLEPVSVATAEDYHWYSTEDIKKVVSHPKTALKIVTVGGQKWIAPKIDAPARRISNEQH